MKYLIDPDEHWDIEGYWASLESLKDRLSKRSYSFFKKHSFHDGLVVEFSIRNMSLKFKKRQENPTVIVAKVIDYLDDYEYQIIWSGVSKVNFDFDINDKVVIDEDGKRYNEKDYTGLETWNIDELTILDDDFLSHEIELHSGAKIKIIFKSINFKRAQKKYR